MTALSKLLFPIIGALFISALITELHFRLFTDQYFALFLLCTLGIIAVSLGSMGIAAVVNKNAADGSRDSAPRQKRRRPKPAKAVSKAEPEPASEADRETGTVKWFNRNKGYGFIMRDAGDEIFVHFKSIRGSGRRNLHDGQRVSFLVTGHEKGLQADQVVALDEPSDS